MWAAQSSVFEQSKSKEAYANRSKVAEVLLEAGADVNLEAKV